MGRLVKTRGRFLMSCLVMRGILQGVVGEN